MQRYMMCDCLTNDLGVSIWYDEVSPYQVGNTKAGIKSNQSKDKIECYGGLLQGLDQRDRKDTH